MKVKQNICYRKFRRSVSRELAVTTPVKPETQHSKPSTVNQKECFGRCRKNPPDGSSKNEQTHSATATIFPLLDGDDRQVRGPISMTLPRSPSGRKKLRYLTAVDNISSPEWTAVALDGLRQVYNRTYARHRFTVLDVKDVKRRGDG